MSTVAAPSPTAVLSTDADTSTVTASLEVCPCFEGLSSGLDNTQQARIRAVLSAPGVPNVDVYVNGLPASNGGKLQQNIARNQFSGWLYVAPGTYTVALVPHGGTLAQAILAPATVNAEAGHRYTVAMVGQVQDRDIRPLVVDETAEEAKAGVNAAANHNMAIVEINNVRGAPAIDEVMNGRAGVFNIPYGGVKAGICAEDFVHDVTIVSGHPEIKLLEGDTTCEAGVSYFFPPNNDAPTGVGDGNISQGTSELNTLEFLSEFNRHHVVDNGHLHTFNTLLAAIEKAGLHDQYANGGPYFLLAPTDEAFEALPAAERDALLKDPAALVTLLNAHTVDGHYPWGSLSGAVYGQSNRTVVNRLRKDLIFVDDTLNGAPIGINYSVGNGNRFQVVYSLLPVK